jgi:phosphatidylserine decarboxylase
LTFAREAWPLVLPLLLATGLLFALGWHRSAVVALVAGLAVLLFFRIPQRAFEGDPSILLSPASGRVTSIEVVEDEAVGEGRFLRVATFLSVFDVHVQRSPANAVVVETASRKGKKVAAFRRDAAEVNESRLTVLRLASGQLIGVRQIAGLVARRVVGYAKRGDELHRGELVGLIKFGSRVDLLVPAEEFEILVQPGDRVRDGATPMARPIQVQ